MVTILSRKRWTSAAKGFPRFSSRKLTPSKVVRLAPHYPAAGNVKFSNPTLAQSAQRLRNWRNYHVNSNGWADIGYNLSIDQAGRIFDCAGITHAAAHALNNNFTAIAVLFIVGDNERPSAAARASFRALGQYLRANHFKSMRIVPVDHGNLPGNSTSCAGQPIRKEIAAGNLSFPASSNQGKPKGGVYTVKAGDTLSHVAQKFSTTVSKLASDNKLSNPNLIRVGQTIRVPEVGSGGGSDSGGEGSSSKKSAQQVAQEIADGKGNWGNDPQRSHRLKSAGYDAADVQRRVNSILSQGGSSGSKQSVSQVAQDIVDGRGGWGNNPQRSRRLRAAGYSPSQVQREVNRILSRSRRSRNARKSVSLLASEVIRGVWGNEPQRSRRLRSSGYDPAAVQREVNSRY